MKRTTQLLRSLIMIVMTAVAFTSCVDKEYDDIATANTDPALTATHTIKQLQEMVPVSGSFLEINTDIIIKGVVTGDDLTGNIYKKLILQEDSSGVAISLDISNFNTEYPTGRRVFVKCNGLFIANLDGNFEIGASYAAGADFVDRIPAGLATKYLVKGMWGQYLTPKVYTFDNPNIPTNTLVKFDDVQFDAGFTGIAYAAVSPANLDLIDCNNNILILYSSTFATFAHAKTPVGKGSIVGVYTIYNGEGELQIRDTTDVNMGGLRCDGSTGQPSLISLDSVRMMYSGTPVTLSDKKIQVTVISDYTTNMLGVSSRNLYVQQDTTGIQLRLSDPSTFAVGSKIEVNVSGAELSTFNGVLQLNYIPFGAVTVIGSGSITPKITTIAEINANYSTREGSLLTIPGVTITGTGTYNGTAGSNTLTDATGSIVLYTGSSATFKNDLYPTGTVSVTGILTQFNGTYEILIRNPSDVQ